MEEKVLNAALAGLLHDVGKVEQRARTDPWNPAPDLGDTGQPVHASWSIYFAQTYVPSEYRGAALAGGYHHRPEASPAQDRTLSELVALADKLSAGERADLTLDYKDKKPPQQMVTIFDRLMFGGEQPRPAHYLPLAGLTLDEKKRVIFPGAAHSKDAQGNAYDDLRHLLEETAKQGSPDAETYLENLLAAMQTATWCVPSAYYYSIPDVSLYDHSRMTAALAVCLSELEAKDVQARLEAVRRDFEGKPQGTDRALLDQPVALLVGGDISGVQKFIYTISSKKAAQTLRGRSFYLQLLTEAVLRYVLRELGLPYTNVIYSGGGHFYLLAPLSAKDRLGDIRRFVSQTLLEHHGSALYLALGCAEVPASGFKIGQFPVHWDKMHGQLNRAKQNRYVELGDALYEQVFKPQEHGGNREETCAVCGEEARQTTPITDDEEGGRICALCSSFSKDIGSRLPQARFVALGLSEPRPTSRGSALDALRAFGLSVRFAESANDPIEFVEAPERAVLWAFDDPPGGRWPTVRGAPTARMVRYTVNVVPRKDFNKLQDDAHGIPRLGVLRMDVDNLGDLFKDGFGKKEKSIASLARISTLSFQMSLFFEGWVRRLCDAHPDLIYAVYAGGDDVFLIGPWDRMPGLATTIAAELQEYAGDNPRVRVSGGMAFIHGKYPVYQAADDAHEALEMAKGVDGKDAFGFLGQAWKWDDFAKVTDKFERLKRLVGDPKNAGGGLGGSQAILQTLRQLANDEADAAKRRNDRPVWGPWMWMGAYQFVRWAKQAGNESPLGGELLQIHKELSDNNYSDIRQWGAAARWVQLWLREK